MKHRKICTGMCIHAKASQDCKTLIIIILFPLILKAQDCSLGPPCTIAQDAPSLWFMHQLGLHLYSYIRQFDMTISDRTWAMGTGAGLCLSWRPCSFSASSPFLAISGSTFSCQHCSEQLAAQSSFATQPTFANFSTHTIWLHRCVIQTDWFFHILVIICLSNLPVIISTAHWFAM